MDIPQTKVDELFSEIELLRKDLAQVTYQLVELRLRDEEHKRNTEKFWATEWSQLVNTTSNHSDKIHDLEKISAVFDSKLADSAKLGVGVGAASGGLFAGIIELIRGLL